MNDFLKNMLNQTKEFFKKLTRGQIIRLSILVVLLLAIAIVATVMLGRTTYATLYSGMDATNASQIYQLLKDQGVDVRTSGTENVTIMVPENQVEDLRLSLNAQGYPKTGYNYDLFNQTTSFFGTSDKSTQQLIIYQLEEHLNVTIANMERVKACHVILNIPKNNLYVIDPNAAKSSASVSLTLNDGGGLSQSEVDAIAGLVARSANNMSAEDVIIVDQSMRSYSVADNTGMGAMTDRQSATEAVKQSYINTLNTLLDFVVGVGKHQSALNVVLNFDDVTQQSIEYSPPVPDAGNTGIIVSAATLYERIAGDETTAGEVGTDPNGTGIVQYPTVATDTNAPYVKLEEKYNYEINELITNTTKAKGTVSQISASIVVDTDRDYSAEIIDLVSKGLGIKPADITVQRFSSMLETEPAEERTGLSATAAKMYSDIARVAIIAISLLVVIFMIIKVIRDALKKPEPEILEGDMPLGAGGQFDFSVGEDDLEIDVNRKSPDRERIEKLIEKDPTSVAALLRNWLVEED